MATIMWVGLGGFLGANARYWLGLWVANRWGNGFPYGTLVANALGSLVLAFLLTLAVGNVSLSPGARLFVAVGFLGGFTTFSTFSYETIALMGQSRWWAALLNVAASMGLGLAGAALGVVAARWLQRGA